MTKEFGMLMEEKYSPVIEKLKKEKRIDNVQYIIARDLLFDLTEGNDLITEENNIAEEYFENENELAERLDSAYEEIKKVYPDIMNWEFDDVNEVSMGLAIDYCEY